MSTGTCLTRENSTHSKRSDESRKVGRFELTSTESSRQTSVVESVSTQSSGKVSAQLEELLKQNEIQRNVLNEIYQNMESPKQTQQDIIVRFTYLRKTNAYRLTCRKHSSNSFRLINARTFYYKERMKR